MPNKPIRERLIPYRVLSYLLYAPENTVEWLQRVSEDEVRIITGPMSRALRMKISGLWDTIFWLEEQNLIEKVQKEKKRGTVVIKLRRPTNIEKKGA